ncbi:hypothetical protein K458DRAFT_387427 [Lentithecium fluviatile CBS 122367]|uniref:F-box domain-containing protein n=1 Tax=Lentithecium fluviatile CBS 122367 TaxID=1168545 RepID=A0A6G1J785_9PLEO|nr:hypothetical protein K458DRAFT_387427 [Lentithecium fluviatile CBS 122367]
MSLHLEIASVRKKARCSNPLNTTPTFRVIDLPTELRYIIYKHLQVYTMHDYVVAEKPKEARPEHDAPKVTLITHGVPVQILATCRQINVEAKPFLARKLKPVRSIVP